MASSARGLRELQRALAALPSETPITAGLLSEKLDEAASAAENSDWEDYMGEDL